MVMYIGQGRSKSRWYDTSMIGQEDNMSDVVMTRTTMLENKVRQNYEKGLITLDEMNNDLELVRSGVVVD